VNLTGLALSVGSAALGVGLLRVAWTRRGSTRLLTTSGWLVLLGGISAWHNTGVAWDEATALAALVPSLIAFALLARHAEWRPARPNARRTLEPTVLEPGAAGPPPMPGQYRNDRAHVRTISRIILAGPLALAAALGLAAVIALHAPTLAANRLVTAELCLPLAWAIGAVWTTMTDNLTRVAVVLTLTAVVGLGGAAL
jgi:hypothetical protein